MESGESVRRNVRVPQLLLNVQKHYINPETHFIERQSGNMDNLTGELQPSVITFKNYKIVDGIA